MSDEAEELRTLIREAHEVLGDLRREVKTARAVGPEIVSGILDDAVTKGLATFHDELGKARDEAVDRIFRRFDELMVRLLGKAGKDRFSIEEYIDRLPDRGPS